MGNKRTKEPQYDIQFETMNKKGPVELGPTPSHLWRTDPRHLCFLLSRYKFVSKLLADKENVLEVGCGDAFGTRLVLQTVKHIHGVDFDPLFIKWAQDQYQKEKLTASFEVVDLIKRAPTGGPYDAVYALDFIEHIKKEKENTVIENMCRVLKPDAVCVLGAPNVTASQYAGRDSSIGHINLKSAEEMKALLAGYFQNVLVFSMNDEVVHTGFYPMAHYIFGVGIGLKKGDK
jgi:2-polyprenyl-3-methyl-5-hydroxy-6-metoxy-1,4-benzoquinol methylase